MLRPRVIPILLLDDEKLVKTRKFRNPQYIGDPINAIRIFNGKEVDEIIVTDISASRLNKSPNFTLIEELASECFMPLTYGGGIASMQDADRLFSLGIEKISVQSAAIDSPELLGQLVAKFGSQAIVLSVDIKIGLGGEVKLIRNSRRRNRQPRWADLVDQAIKAGVGEILICDVSKEGTLSGIDADTVRTVTRNINVPVVYTGGVNKYADFRTALSNGADAVGVGAYFTLQGPNRAVLITYPKPELIEAI